MAVKIHTDVFVCLSSETYEYSMFMTYCAVQLRLLSCDFMTAKND
jgi:hypothetical protein